MNLAISRRSLLYGLRIEMVVLGTGCGQHDGNSCPAFAAIVPQVQQLYPIPGASDVPDAIGVLVYGSTQTVPLILSSGVESVPTQPIGVPSPLPSPAATPRFPDEGVYGVRLPVLKPQTTYSAIATVTFVSGCSPTRTCPEQIGTFTTR